MAGVKGKSGIYKRTKKIRESLSKAHIGKLPWNKGKKLPPHSKETKEKMSKSHKGDEHWNWKGGITSASKSRRNNYKYKMWRTAVFTRDNWTCQSCGARGYVEAHHIRSISAFPKLIYDIDNGVTLCFECHKLADKYRARFKEVYKKGG